MISSCSLIINRRKIIYVKDLSKITSSDLKDVIIVDNNSVSYLFNKTNGIPILSWHDDPNDDELLKIEIILQRLTRVNDVRQIIKQIICNNMIDYEKSKQVFDNLKRKSGFSIPPHNSIAYS